LKLEDVNFKYELEQLYKTDLDKKHKKAIANITIGIIEKRVNKSELTKVFKNYNEANEYAVKYEGKLLTLSYEDDDIDETQFIYVVKLDKTSQLINGLLPIKEMIYTNQKLKILKNYDTLVKHKEIKIYGIRTDCILYESSNNADYYVSQKLNIADGMGNYKFERNKSVQSNVIEVEENTLIEIDYYESNKVHIFKDEKDINETNEYLKTKNCLILGDYAGVGKSSLCKNYDKDSLFVCPYNKLCQVLRKDGYNAITYSKLFGLYGDDKELANKKSYDLTGIKTVVFDEIFLYEPKRLMKISQLMHSNKQVKFLATGDTNQRNPISFNNSKYLMDCMNILFQHKVMLKDIKRLNNDVDKEIMKNLKIDILSSQISVKELCKKYNLKTVSKISEVDTKKNICYFNKKCMEVNRHIYLLLHPEKRNRI